jgi:hypothetical protein
MALWGTPGTSSLISLVPSENSVLMPSSVAAPVRTNLGASFIGCCREELKCQRHNHLQAIDVSAVA